MDSLPPKEFTAEVRTCISDVRHYPSSSDRFSFVDPESPKLYLSAGTGSIYTADIVSQEFIQAQNEQHMLFEAINMENKPEIEDFGG